MSYGHGNSQCQPPPRPPNKGPVNKFWGVWLPVPTLLGIINTIFWTWLILSTVGYTDRRLEKAVEWISERF